MNIKKKLAPGFTKKYNITKLVYFEETHDITAAIAREKQLKGWLRKKKISLIESVNPMWSDLSGKWLETDSSPAAQNDKGERLRMTRGEGHEEKILKSDG